MFSRNERKFLNLNTCYGGIYTYVITFKFNHNINYTYITWTYTIIVYGFNIFPIII